MRLDDFRALVRRMAGEIPPDFLEGVVEVVVSPRTLPHPTRAEIYTLGECIPLHDGDAPDAVQSRVVLYHGSFAALARLTPGFDWRAEAWETLTHELRHHLEWRARAPDLEAFDQAAEENFARQEGESFDPLFFLAGESPAAGVHQVDDDWFLDQVVRRMPARLEFGWHGRAYEAEVPAGARLPAYFHVVDGVAEPPPGDLVVVCRRAPGLLDLLRGSAPLFQADVRARPAGGYTSGRTSGAEAPE
ncbi:MAG TPA: metallopeptidase family protein [Gemmatimonadales bacterium]|nr:metallopeptidase family protein [Gemmatimonadales bacterium]